MERQLELPLELPSIAEKLIVESEYDHAETVDHPRHYNQHPSGVECIDIIEHMPFNVGTAIKHLWRCDEKYPEPYEDLEKAVWYIRREIRRRKLMGRRAEHE